MSLRETLETTNPSLWDYLKDEANLRELKEERTSRQRRNFLFHRHFNTFEEVSVAVKRCWRKDTLFQSLLKLTQSMPTQELTARLDVLEDCMARNFDDEETNCGIRDFLKDLDFLRDLRNTFEIQIMDTLECFFIEHKDLHMPEYYSFMDSKYYEITRSPLTVTVMEDLQDRLHLSELIASLKGARHKWRDLVETRMDSTIQSSCFEKNSRSEILKFAGYDHLEPYLRIIPDSMTKLDRCLSLAKSVWNVCDRRNRDKHTRMETMNDTLTQVKGRHNDLELEIEITEQRKQEVGAKLRDLDWDSLKFDNMREEYEQCLSIVTMGEIDLYEMNKKRINLYERSQKAQSSEDAHAFNCAYDRYFEARRSFLEKKSEIAVVRSRANILRDHLEIDAALKCSAMRFKGGVQEEYEQIEEQLESLKEELKAVQIECKALEDSIYFSIEADDQKALKAVRDLSSLSYENDYNQNYRHSLESRASSTTPVRAIEYANRTEQPEKEINISENRSTVKSTGSPETFKENNIFLTSMAEKEDTKLVEPNTEPADTAQNFETFEATSSGEGIGGKNNRNYEKEKTSAKRSAEKPAEAKDSQTSTGGFPNKKPQDAQPKNVKTGNDNPETPSHSPFEVKNLEGQPEMEPQHIAIANSAQTAKRRNNSKGKSHSKSGMSNAHVKNKSNGGGNTRNN